MKKYRIFYDFEKEEKWLLEMALKGYQLKSTGAFHYKFEPALPEASIIRVDYRILTSDYDFMAYRTMYEDQGWEHIAGKRQNGFQYFKNKSDDKDAHIYSDVDSLVERYKRRVIITPASFWIMLICQAIIWSQIIYNFDWDFTRPISIMQFVLFVFVVVLIFGGVITYRKKIRRIMNNKIVDE